MNVHQRLQVSDPRCRPLYEEALEFLQDFSSAIIFPEQFLNHNIVFFTSIKTTRTGKKNAIQVLKTTVTKRCTHTPRYGIISGPCHNFVRLHTIDDVIKAENNNERMHLPDKEGRPSSMSLWEGKGPFFTYMPMMRAPARYDYRLYYATDYNQRDSVTFTSYNATFADLVDAVKYLAFVTERIAKEE